MADVHGGPGVAAGPLPTRALTLEAGRARQLLAAGEWRLSPADAEAADRVLARLTAPLPTRQGEAARTRATDRDRRLQRIFRTAVHHLDAGAVSPPLAALLAAVARALTAWQASPNPSPAAAAPRYGIAPGTAQGAAPPTEAGEALLPDLASLFTTLAATGAPGGVPVTPSAEPWQVRYEGGFRRYGRPAPGVWTAETVACPGCGRKDGPWTVTCDWRRVTLGCPCGVASDGHGLSLSETWLVLPEV
ncbi:hypothetical protein ABZ946_31230 [Streptomyces sp. NPDC046324]|uniref:hypothetical protein n=1 Tax=Streptomyces sp. NPDC046324 TaxID=3154915 RepID=UPI00340B6ED4